MKEKGRKIQRSDSRSEKGNGKKTRISREENVRPIPRHVFPDQGKMFARALALARSIPAVRPDDEVRFSYFCCLRDDLLDMLHDLSWQMRVKLFQSLVRHTLFSVNSPSGLKIVGSTLEPRFRFRARNCVAMAKAMRKANVGYQEVRSISGGPVNLGSSTDFNLTLDACRVLAGFLREKGKEAEAAELSRFILDAEIWIVEKNSSRVSDQKMHPVKSATVR